MPRTRALIDPARCRPELCNWGICPAVAQCPRHLLHQDATFDVPYFRGDASLCRGCFKCLPVCPQRAIIKG